MPAVGWQRLGQPQDRREQQRDPDRGEHDEDPAPRGDGERLSADQRREHRRDSHHRHQQRENRAAAAPRNRSRTIARAITTPAPPSVPWMNRSTIRVHIDGAPAQASDATTYPVSPTSSGRRRPSESLTGPVNSWPAAIPSSSG